MYERAIYCGCWSSANSYDCNEHSIKPSSDREFERARRRNDLFEASRHCSLLYNLVKPIRLMLSVCDIEYSGGRTEDL
jgi:hypothetical protein